MVDDGRCRAYREFLETLSKESIARLDTLARADIHFRDPFNDAHGLEATKRVFRSLFDEVDDPRFVVSTTACRDDVCFLRWHFTCRPRVFGKGHPWIVDGVSEIRFAADGRVIEHVDYWDAGHYVYERIPLFGLLVRFIRKRIAVVVH